LNIEQYKKQKKAFVFKATKVMKLKMKDHGMIIYQVFLVQI